jgi:hypothetical protein|tara:strand:- start:13728 stop:13865 length:138 start_codon:yes stop_codon:yes gene_type:complete
MNMALGTQLKVTVMRIKKFDNGSLQAFHKSYFDTSDIWSGGLEQH